MLLHARSAPVSVSYTHLDVYKRQGLDDGWVRELLVRHAGESPKELAARLVTEAKGRGHDDDRTALVMRIERL